MTTYYKAVRTDRLDFFSQSTKYMVGLTLLPAIPRAAAITNPRICSEDVLHAADDPSATLVVGEWPCRLYEVSGVPVVGFDDNNPHKGGFRSLKAVRALPSWLVLGPQGQRIAAVIKRAWSITVRVAERLEAERREARSGLRVHDFYAAQSAAESATQGAARGIALGAAMGAAYNVVDHLCGEDPTDSVPWGAVVNVIQALMVRDLIGVGRFETLSAPWVKVIGDKESDMPLDMETILKHYPKFKEAQ